MLQMLPKDQISDAIRTLTSGGVILYPTDTVWGLGCKFDEKEAYTKLRGLKNRPENQSFILIVSSIEQLKKYINYIHPRVETLLTMHQRPLTIVYKDPKNIPAHCLAEDGSIAIRVVSDPFCQALTKALGCPISSTSANAHGEPTPTHFGEIRSDIISNADYVFDYRRSKANHGEPSVIAEFNKKGDLIFIRE